MSHAGSESHTKTDISSEICEFLRCAGAVDLGTVCRMVRELSGIHEVANIPGVLAELVARGRIEVAVRPGTPRVLVLQLAPGS